MMDNETLTEEPTHKKGRHRKKQLYNSIMQQMEFYFSDSNLAKDKFLFPLVQNNSDIEISIFLKFNKIRKLTSNIQDIVKAINNSEVLELSEDKTKVRRNTPINIKENVDDCTLYVERIKVDATQEWLASIFCEFGNVTYVSIPKYKHNKVNKGFAFVEFEREQDAIDALDYFQSLGCKMSLLTPAEELRSIVTFENNDGSEMTNDTEQSEHNDGFNVNIQKKRKHSSEEVDENRKKLKVEDGGADVDNKKFVSDDSDEKKKKKHKKNKKKIFKELGLQVLSKAEWKKIRNRYLDNQREKMKQLKQFLHRKKFSNHATESKLKLEEQTVNSTKEKPVEKLEYIPGVIVKIVLPESCHDLKSIKDDLKQYSSEIKYIDVAPGANEGHLRFSDSDSAEKFCTSSEYKGRALLLAGPEEEEYWTRVTKARSSKFEKNQKRHVRGREKLLKKAEKELGKHIKFDDTD